VWGRLHLKLRDVPTMPAADLPLQELRVCVKGSCSWHGPATLVSALAQRQTLRVLYVNLPLPTQKAALQTLAEYTELEEVAAGLADPSVVHRYGPGPEWAFPGWPKLRKFSQFQIIRDGFRLLTFTTAEWVRYERHFLSVRRSLDHPWCAVASRSGWRLPRTRAGSRCTSWTCCRPGPSTAAEGRQGRCLGR